MCQGGGEPIAGPIPVVVWLYPMKDSEVRWNCELPAASRRGATPHKT